MGLRILEQLREQTRPAHLALETQPSLTKLMSSALTEAEYCRLLQSMHAFYQALESQLVPATEALVGQYRHQEYRYRRRVPLLADDCRAFGCDISRPRYSPAELRMDGNDAFLVGVLYVIEGSTLGGRLISSHLENTLGVRENSGARFFNLYRHDNSWRAFRRWLSTDLSYNDQDATKSAIEGANMTFTALHSHLDQWRAPVYGS